uniref:tRNA preQ1(34) S-adenosylmethionine ribosyltransferase-isomerase QueA n=1 Tax=Castellaniella defragrans TaxID=75697 RepID=UPI0033427A2B
MEHELDLSQFDYELPPELIAQAPAAQRNASRLLRLDATGGLHDLRFLDLPTLLRAGDLLVFNDTRVIKARLHGHKASGGKVEVLVERITGPQQALAHVRASKSPKPGTRLVLADGAFEAEVAGRAGELFDLRFPERVLDLLERHGAVPLPPYITHAADAGDEARYQTIYAKQPGAVAAPTAGLHFDQAMLEHLDAQGIGRACVTLHVGAGTFQPVRAARLRDHVMHAEHYAVAADTLRRVQETRAAGGRVIAVGTTSVRALEAATAQNGDEDSPREGDTRLFITPGYTFACIDALITNFHLPQSTLLMLVSALAGMEPIRRAYAHAVRSRYRFFSYGDAMFIEAAQGLATTDQRQTQTP